MIKSRYVSVDDKYMKHFSTGPRFLKLLGIKIHYWNFVKTGWWSRAYEYQLINDVVHNAFGLDVIHKTALDFGCGDAHPGLFIIEKLKFNKVYGCDLFDHHPLLKTKKFNINYFKNHLSGPKIQYDLITIISVLEHLEPKLQKDILLDLISMLSDDGVIILTFDMPGFEYKTDLSLYLNIFKENGIIYKLDELDVSKRLDNFNSVAAFPKGWPKLGMKRAECYRLVGYKKS